MIRSMDLICQLCLKMPCECGSGEAPQAILEQNVRDGIQALIAHLPKGHNTIEDLNTGLESVGRLFTGFKMKPEVLILLLTSDSSPFKMDNDELIETADGLLQAAGIDLLADDRAKA